MNRLMRSATILSFLAMISCTKAGVQGTNLLSTFNGIQSVVALSPSVVRLNWNLDSKYISYNIYMNGGSSPLKTETFASTLITGLIADQQYSFKVTGVQSDLTEEDLGGTQVVSTLKHFDGLTAGGVTVASPTQANLTWSMNSNTVTYKIFRKLNSAAWDLTKPYGNVIANNQYNVIDLTSGQTYCFFIQANYLDGSVEPIAATESEINAKAPCQQMTSQLVGLPAVWVSSVSPGPFPWFWTSGGDATYRTEIFELDTNVRVASRTGNGSFRSFISTPEGTKNYYANVSNATASQVARVQVNISGQVAKTSTKIRTVANTGSHGPVFPPLMNGGSGAQNLGSKVVSGDFNCDGLTDVAVSIPSSVIVPSANHFTNTGGVVVYYGYREAGPCYDSGGSPITCPHALKTNGTPSISNSYPNPVIISYPPSQNNFNQGRSLAVGNFNGDCYENAPVMALGLSRSGSCNALFVAETNQGNYQSIKSCDDLVIGNDAGSFYVVYGNPTLGLVSGSGASTAGLNEFTCDSFSNDCRVVQMTVPAGVSNSKFANAIAVGDFNNDGFDDLAVSGTNTSTSLTDMLMYRGSGQGVYPQGVAGNHVNVISNVTPGLTTYGTISSADGFGESATAVPDSRDCQNGTPGGITYRNPQPTKKIGYDLTKCADMVIGAPNRSSNRGSIFACKANTLSNSLTANSPQITGWTCGETWPTGISASANYGKTVIGVKNLLGYPLFNIKNTPPLVPDIAGALFVGAPSADVLSGGLTYTQAGAVYGYYVTPLGNSFSNGIMSVLGTGVHTVAAQNSVPCNHLNNNRTGTYCENQLITMAPPESGAEFGSAFGQFPKIDQEIPSEASPKYLAVSAPKKNAFVNGATVADSGAVYLYRTDVSTFTTDGGAPVLTAQLSIGKETQLSPGTCTSVCTWYSGGLSPYAPSVFYPLDLKAGALFGNGGSAGGAFNNDTESDLISSAPKQSLPAPEAGANYIFYGNSGFSPTENIPDQTLNPSIGLEGGYKFEEAQVIGDINGDGYDDVATHINANSTWSMVVYYGSAAGLVTSPSPSTSAFGSLPLSIRNSTDSGFGVAFFPAGDINGDGFADIVIIGYSASYIYYGSSAGLAPGNPVVAPVGKSPLKFASNSNGFVSLSSAITNSAYFASPPTTYYNFGMNISSIGDFNGDGFGDFAIRLPINSAVGSADPGSGMYFASNQVGRVLVFYGSVNGTQVNRLTGTIQLVDGSNNPVDIAVQNPCTVVTSGNPAVCKVQVLGPPANVASTGYGFAMATLKHKAGVTSPVNDRLLISDISASSNAGAVYAYEGGFQGLNITVKQTLVGKNIPAGERFGSVLANVGDVNKDDYDDLAVSNGQTASPKVYVFYGAFLGSDIGYYGATNMSSTNYWYGPAPADNDQFTIGNPRPQIIRPNSIAATEQFGYGISKAGDFNNDGYADMIVNVPNGDSLSQGLVVGTGYAILYFGSATGFNTQGVVLSEFPRCYGGSSPVCDPFQIYLPGSSAFENTALNPNISGDLNGDGLADVMINGVGRDLISTGQKSATSAGVIYVIY